MERLVIERAKRRMSIRTLAEKSGVMPGTISEIERGIRKPHPGTLAKLADALDMPVEALFEEHESEQFEEENRRIEQTLGKIDETLWSSITRDDLEEARVYEGEKPRAWGYPDEKKLQEELEKLPGDVLASQLIDARKELLLLRSRFAEIKQRQQKEGAYGETGIVREDA